jgi:hypothetical protein
MVRIALHVASPWASASTGDRRDLRNITTEIDLSQRRLAWLHTPAICGSR